MICRVGYTEGYIANSRFELDPRWSDTGDRYILKLFRDYVFHSISVDGSPILDLSHVLTCLNKVNILSGRDSAVQNRFADRETPRAQLMIARHWPR